MASSFLALSLLAPDSGPGCAAEASEREASAITSVAETSSGTSSAGEAMLETPTKSSTEVPSSLATIPSSFPSPSLLPPDPAAGSAAEAPVRESLAVRSFGETSSRTFSAGKATLDITLAPSTDVPSSSAGVGAV
jgi:hypothetical protein